MKRSIKDNLFLVTDENLRKEYVSKMIDALREKSGCVYKVFCTPDEMNEAVDELDKFTNIKTVKANPLFYGILNTIDCLLGNEHKMPADEKNKSIAVLLKNAVKMEICGVGDDEFFNIVVIFYTTNPLNIVYTYVY